MKHPQTVSSEAEMTDKKTKKKKTEQATEVISIVLLSHKKMIKKYVKEISAGDFYLTLNVKDIII